MNNLTKRDTFAAAALTGILASPDSERNFLTKVCHDQQTPTTKLFRETIALSSYSIADAMCALSNQTVEEIAEPIIIAKQRGQIESQQSRIESLESDIRNLADGFPEKDARIVELTEALRPFAQIDTSQVLEDSKFVGLPSKLLFEQIEKAKTVLGGL